jgi:hypothetical protein
MKTQPYGYLIKPFRDRELHSTIEIALYKHRLMKRQNAGPVAAVPASPAPAPVASGPEEENRLPVPFEKVILAVIDIPVFVLNRDMRIVYFNAALDRFFRKMGYLAAREDQSVFDVAPPSFLGTPQMYREVFETRRISRMEKTIIVDDRKATYSLVRIPLLEGDTVRYVGVILRDVSQELQNSQKQREMYDSYQKLLTQLAEITELIQDDNDPKIQKISRIASDMVITLALMDPQLPRGR